MRRRVHPEEGDIHQEADRQSIISLTSWLTGKEALVWEGPTCDSVDENDSIKTAEWPREDEVQGLSG